VLLILNMEVSHNLTGASRITLRHWKRVKHLRIDRNFCSVHEKITSIRLYTPCNPRSWLRNGVYNLIEVISNEPDK
jgi:hypothetical protein